MRLYETQPLSSCAPNLMCASRTSSSYTRRTLCRLSHSKALYKESKIALFMGEWRTQGGSKGNKIRKKRERRGSHDERVGMR